MTLDTVSDLTRDILELADNDITDKVRATANLSHPSGYTQSQKCLHLMFFFFSN